ncbi:MAG: GspE/PulE family protein [Lachnospirales bacterium]
MNKKLRLGDILIKQKKITDEQLMEALIAQKEMGIKLGEALTIKGMISEKEILEVLQEQLGVPFMDASKVEVDPQIPTLLPENIARKHRVIPIKVMNGKLLLLTGNPLDVYSLDDVRLITGFELELALAEKSIIDGLINQYYDGREDAEKAIEEFTEQNEDIFNIEEDIEDDDVTNAPIVRLINGVINQAIRANASDIHVEPFSDRLRIRFRIDGNLLEHMTTTMATHAPIVARMKIIGGMDISEKRKPQDGRLETKIGDKEIDMRISILPTVYGEKVVIRLLDRTMAIGKISELGFSETNLEMFKKIIKVPEGMILVTGPTGSGKTTTLFTVLKDLNKVSQNIITVEDPVEYRIDGVNQVQVNERAGLNFANSLRSILRQDPDVVMVGEIRDSETATIAVRAAITGHVVLSTLHTNDSVSTVIRLIDMGIEDYLVSTAVAGVVAQRLIRKICPRCIESYESTETEMKALKLNEPTTLYRGKGCSYCNRTGYKGRTPIHEVFVVDREIKAMLDERRSVNDIKDKAVEKGMSTLFDNAKDLALQGITSVQETIKVAYTID